MLNLNDEEENCKVYFKLLIDKMSRLFFFKHKKYFSVSFPFTVVVEGSTVLEVSTYTGRSIGFEIISSAISILNNLEFQLDPSPLNFWADSNNSELEALYLLEEIFLFEPGYLRYDWDPVNENGKLHPLHHIDVNYSGYGTFKIGLNRELIIDEFQDVLNIRTNCRFFV